MKELKYTCGLCDDPILEFQKAYHTGCAEIYFEKKIYKLRKEIETLEKKLGWATHTIYKD